MDKIEVKVQGITKGLAFRGLFILLLCEVDGDRKFPLIIGESDAQAITLKMDSRKMKSSDVSDILFEITNRCEIKMDSLIIHKVDDGVFRASTVFCGKSEVFRFELRASDAVCLSLVYDVPIYVDKELFESQYSKEQGDGQVFLPVNTLSLTLLEEVLEVAVREEDFELASQLRDEIKRRK